jgi:hypothetical protein
VLALQTGPSITGGGPLALVITLLLAAVFYAVTLHLAATFFLGSVKSQKAATVAPVLAVVSLLLQRWGPGITIAVTVLVDAAAIRRVYGLPNRATVALTALHFAFAVVLGLALNNLFGLV